MMERQFYLLIAFLFFLSATASGQRGITRIYTDYDTFWTSAQNSINPVKPDNRNNLLGFTWNGRTYSTGVNDAILTAKGVSFEPGLYQAFPVANIPLNGLNQNFIALGYKEDGNNTGGNYPYTVPVKVSDILTRGINGLDMGSGITNIPASAEPLLFNFGAIADPTQIGDGVPDLLITQVASPGANNLDRVWFEDANHNRVGNEVTIDMSDTQLVPSVGNWTLDLYSPVTGILNTAKTDRQIRIWAADASLFGLNASNYTQPLYLRYKLGGSSDPAFLAFNRKFIEIISPRDDNAFTEVNAPVNIDVLVNDVPALAIAPSSLSILHQPGHGTVTVVVQNGTRVVRYQPAPGYEGTDSFTYQVSNNAAIPSSGDAVVTITVGAADLSVVKTFRPAVTYFGDEISFDITVKNNGSGTASQVVLNDLIPSGYTYISSVSSIPATFNPIAGTLTIGTMLAGESIRLHIKAIVKTTGIYTNTANVTGTSLDRYPANNTSTVTPVPVPRPLADLAIQKTLDNASLNNNTAFFTITVTNNGPDMTPNVIVKDVLPSGYTYISSGSQTGAYNARTGEWTFGSLPVGSSAVLTINTSLNSAGNYVNTAIVSSDAQDPVTGNNTDSASPAPLAPSGNAQQSFCEADQPTVAVLMAQGAGIKWYAAATGGTPLANAVRLINGSSYFASQTIAGAESMNRFQVRVVLIPTPAPPLPVNQIPVAYCRTDPAAPLQAVATPGNTLLWYTAVIGGTAELTAPTPQTTTAGTAIYYVSQRNGFGCEGPRTAISVIVNELPPAPVSGGDQTACETGAPLSLTATASTVPGHSIIWYDASDQIVLQPVLSAIGTVTYYAVSKNNTTGCQGIERTAVKLTINPLPPHPVSGGDQAECPAFPVQTLIASATTTAGNTVGWYDAAGNRVNSPSLNYPGSITYYAVSKNIVTGCESLQRTPVTLTIYPPVEANVQVDQPGCSNQTGSIAVTSATGTSFSISPADQSFPPMTNNTGKFMDLQPGEYTLLVTSSAGCTLTVPGIQVNTPFCPSVSLTKDANNAGQKAGDIINYTLVVKNTGNVALSDLSVTDNQADQRSISPAAVSLSPGQTATVKASHTLTQAEVNHGSFSNQASVKGLAPDHSVVTDLLSDDPGTATADDPTVVQIQATPAITLVKTGILSTDYETVSYTFSIRNTGNVTLYSVRLQDEKLGIDRVLQAEIQPGEIITYNALYLLTINDKTARSTTNTARVTASSPAGMPVTDISGTQQNNDLPTIIPIPWDASVALVKTASLTGNQVTYTFTITNTGKLSLSTLTISDPKLGLDNKAFRGTIYPGSSLSFDQVYQLTQTDRELGRVINTATVNAVTQIGVTVSDRSGTEISNDVPTVVIVPHAPAAVNDHAETRANSPVIIDILTNDDPVNSSFDKSSIVITNPPENGTVFINSDGTVNYIPSPGFTGQDAFSYHVSDVNGYRTNNALVSINANFFNLIIPNTFTPNGDGINDYFTVIGLNQYADNELTIVNRWGNELYRKRNYENNWTGDSLGEGTYFYLLKVKRKGNQQYEVFKGWVLLKRNYVN